MAVTTWESPNDESTAIRFRYTLDRCGMAGDRRPVDFGKRQEATIIASLEYPDRWPCTLPYGEGAQREHRGSTEEQDDRISVSVAFHWWILPCMEANSMDGRRH